MADAVFELALRGLWIGKQWALVTHCKGDSLGDGLALFAQELSDAIWGDHAAKYDNAFSVESWHARMIDPNPSLYEGAMNTPFVGTNGFVPMATQCALVVTTRTGYAGRRKRGRHYIAGLGEDNLGQDGKFASALTSALQTSFNTFISSSPASTGNYEWGVWSAKNGETRNSNGDLVSVNILAGFLPITEAIVRTIPAIQRRRRLAS